MRSLKPYLIIALFFLLAAAAVYAFFMYITYASMKEMNDRSASAFYTACSNLTI